MKELIQETKSRKNIIISAIIFLSLIAMVIFLSKVVIDSNNIKGSKYAKNDINGHERLNTLEDRKDMEYGWKESQNEFSIIIEIETKNYFSDEEFVFVPELTVYDTYSRPGKAGEKTIKYKRIYKSGELKKELILNESITKESHPPVYFQGTKDMVREANQLMKNLTVLANSPQDYTYDIRNDHLLDVYYLGKKYLHVNREYITFLNYPTLDEFLEIARIAGHGENDIAILTDGYNKLSNGENFFTNNRFIVKVDGGKFKFMTPIPKRIQNEYYQLLDFDTYYEKYGKKNQ